MAGKSPREAAKGRAKSRQASASKKKRTHSFTVEVTTPDLAEAKKKLRKVGRVLDTPHRKLREVGARGGKAAAKEVGSDVARGKARRDAKMRATGSRADASAKLAERKKQKATRGRIAAQKRTGRGSGGG